MLSNQLKEKTKMAHQKLEKILVQKIKSIQTPDEYVAILTSFYTFWIPLEKLIFSHIGGRVTDISQRRKADWLMKDLNYFNTSHPKMRPSPHLPVIENSYQALGALYVMEGSTLGGRAICKMISQKLEVSTSEGFAFFAGYEEETDEMWKSFIVYLNSQEVAPEVENEIVEAADSTFQLFGQSIRAESNTNILR